MSHTGLAFSQVLRAGLGSESIETYNVLLHFAMRGMQDRDGMLDRRQKVRDGWMGGRGLTENEIDKEVVVLLLRAKADCSPEMRLLYLPQGQLHRTLSGGQRLGSLG